MEMEGMNASDKVPTPPTQLQPNVGVPSIFLAPSNIPLPSDGSSSSNQTTQTSVWNSGAEMQQRVRSPPSSGSTADSYKMKTCASTQCGSGYENISTNVSGCQPPLQNRVYPAPYMQQQQMALPVRSMHQHHHHHHHHHGMPCHPQQSAVGVPPHLDRMMHGGSSAVAVAAAQQLRIMNHYPPNSAAYSSSAPSASTFYPQGVTTTTGNAPFLEYNHPHNGHHHGHGISAAAAAAVQYAQQHHQHHQRMVSSATANLNPYRQLPVHHPQQKVMSSSQAATAYQNAYQQHQYTQYLHHHGMIPSHSHPHHHHNGAVGTATGVMQQQRMLGMPMTNLQQQQQAYVNRPGQHIQHASHQQHNQGFASTCPPSLPSNYNGALQQQQQLVNPVVNQQQVSTVNASANGSNPSTTGQLVDLNNNSTSTKSFSSSSDVPGTKPLSQKTSPETLIVSQKSSIKTSSTKLSNASPEKSVKIKASRSVTKLRDRQPRLVVGQKKKSASNISSSSSSRKLKSLKALSAAVTSAISVAGVENLQSCTKRLTSTLVDTDSNSEAKRSKKATKTEEVLVAVDYSAGDASAKENNGNEEKASVGVSESIEELNNNSASEKYFLEEQNGDEYVPTPEEMQKYLERLNTCNNLNIPLYFAYSVFHGKLSKNNTHASSVSDSNSTPGEGTFRTTTTTSTSVFYHYHYDQIEEFNFTTFHNWDPSALSPAELEWINFQDDMAVLEKYFPYLSTMEQSERAEKLDTIYTYEGQMKLMASGSQPVSACNVEDDRISPPCTCVQDAASCSCCYNYMTGVMPNTMRSSEGCGGLSDDLACTNASFGESSPQFLIDPSFHQHLSQTPPFMSTPLSSRRTYDEETHFYESEENTSSFKEQTGTRRTGTRKRSSSYPSRKSGRKSSGSRDHRKSETESFLDELISTANEEKLSKQKNGSGEVAAPEIQCEVDFPSLATSAAIPYSKRHAKKGKGEESMSARDRDEYLASSSTTTDESEYNTSGCSSSPQSTHNTSSEGDFDGGSEIIAGDSEHVANHFMTSNSISSPILMPSSCKNYEHDSNACCSKPAHLWDDFREDEFVPVQPDPFSGAGAMGGASCVPMTNLTNLISHCTCRRVDAICPTRPPPGFEHLSRPAFPLELYDPSLLGNLVGGQLPREVLSSLDASVLPRKQFEEMEELLQSLTCCEKHAVDKMLCSRQTSTSLPSENDDSLEDTDGDWESLEKSIKNVLNEWTEELGFRKRMQDILFSLNLHDAYGGCCKNVPAYEQEEVDHTNISHSSSSLTLKPCTSSTTTEEDKSASLFLQGGVKP